MSWIFLVLVGIDPGVSRLGGEIVSHNTTDARRGLHGMRCFLLSRFGSSWASVWTSRLDGRSEPELCRICWRHAHRGTHPGVWNPQSSRTCWHVSEWRKNSAVLLLQTILSSCSRRFVDASEYRFSFSFHTRDSSLTLCSSKWWSLVTMVRL